MINITNRSAPDPALRECTLHGVRRVCPVPFQKLLSDSFTKPYSDNSDMYLPVFVFGHTFFARTQETTCGWECLVDIVSGRGERKTFRTSRVFKDRQSALAEGQRKIREMDFLIRTRER